QGRPPARGGRRHAAAAAVAAGVRLHRRPRRVGAVQVPRRPVQDRHPAAPRQPAGTVKLPAAVLVITGTGTEVGKTIVTAALASNFSACGAKVAVVKPAQTGATPAEPGDLAEVE